MSCLTIPSDSLKPLLKLSLLYGLRVFLNPELTLYLDYGYLTLLNLDLRLISPLEDRFDLTYQSRC